MKNYQVLPQKLEETTRIFNIQESIAVAFERTSTEPFDIKNMVNDISKEFESLEVLDIQKAIKKGSLGEYGYTYKLSTQAICIWIREYISRSNIAFGKTNQI